MTENIEEPEMTAGGKVADAKYQALLAESQRMPSVEPPGPDPLFEKFKKKHS